MSLRSPVAPPFRSGAEGAPRPVPLPGEAAASPHPCRWEAAPRCALAAPGLVSVRLPLTPGLAPPVPGGPEDAAGWGPLSAPGCTCFAAAVR